MEENLLLLQSILILQSQYEHARIQRWATILLSYNYNIEYRNVKYVQGVDGLSRLAF